MVRPRRFSLTGWLCLLIDRGDDQALLAGMQKPPRSLLRRKRSGAWGKVCVRVADLETGVEHAPHPAKHTRFHSCHLGS